LFKVLLRGFLIKKDYYSILNIDYKSNLKTIKSAYRMLALKYHPDHNPNNPDSLKQFILIREAYETLTTPELKKNYDAHYQPQSTQEPHRQPDAESATKNTTLKNLRYNLYVTLEDVYVGCERTIRYIRKNKKENETVQLSVKVPKGAFHQQRLKLTGFGDTDGANHGDLFVIIQLQNHPVFLKKALDLRVNVPISYLDAALGSSIEIPTLAGIKKIKLDSCKFENINFLLKGFGLPDIKGSYRGNLHVHCFIEHPLKLSNTDKNAMQKFVGPWPKGEMMQQYHSYLNEKKRS
jgi:DnaJ-class molecular chaperone